MSVRTWLFVILMLLSAAAYAELKPFSIPEGMVAMYPSEPVFQERLESEYGFVRTYMAHTDDLMMFVATYAHEPISTNANGRIAVRNYVQELAGGMAGELISSKATAVDGMPAREFVVQSMMEGYRANTYGIVFFDQGDYYQWSVTEVEGITQASAADIVRAHIGRVRLED